MSAVRKSPTADWSIIGIQKNWTAYQCGNICALSSLEMIDDGHQTPHLEWIISFSNMGKRRCSNDEIRKCLRDFQAEDFEEDNHESGIARKFWLAVEHQYRTPCPCKDETIIAQGDYQYSIKKEPTHET